MVFLLILLDIVFPSCNWDKAQFFNSNKFFKCNLKILSSEMDLAEIRVLKRDVWRFL
jgi:hypothetical protein